MRETFKRFPLFDFLIDISAKVYKCETKAIENYVKRGEIEQGKICGI